MPSNYSAEIDAIKVVLDALTPLTPDARERVLKYSREALGVRPESDNSFESLPPRGAATAETHKLTSQRENGESTHIKELREAKKPRSANEMAAVAAYYLSSMAPETERKTVVNTKDIETQFKIAGFKLPKQVKMTLANASNAGYFDSTGKGNYKLNAVGHNLVVHSMPRGEARSQPRARPQPRKRKVRLSATKRKAK